MTPDITMHTLLNTNFWNSAISGIEYKLMPMIYGESFSDVQAE
jgi:hypothetical protein